MRRFGLVISFFLCIALLCSCSGNNYPYKRAHDKKDDVIKFHNFEWLTSKSEVDAKLSKDFGEDSYRIVPQLFYSKANDNFGFYPYLYKGVNGPLDWDIGGNEVDHITLSYARSDTLQTNFLVMARIDYIEHTEEVAKELRKKLRKLYEEIDLYYASHGFDSKYTDANGNVIELCYREKYYDKDSDDYFGDWLYIEYSCGDMNDYFDKLREEYDRQKAREESNGL